MFRDGYISGGRAGNLLIGKVVIRSGYICANRIALQMAGSSISPNAAWIVQRTGRYKF